MTDLGIVDLKSVFPSSLRFPISFALIQAEGHLFLGAPTQVGSWSAPSQNCWSVPEVTRYKDRQTNSARVKKSS